MINAGRLSVPSIYDSPLSSADCDAWRGGPRPGASMLDAPVAARGGASTYLTDAFIKAGTRVALLEFSNGMAGQTFGRAAGTALSSRQAVFWIRTVCVSATAG